MTQCCDKTKPNPFGTELHKLLALIGVKRSAFGERGYTYSLHKQICRGERPPSTRALASLEELLNQRLAAGLTAARREPAKLDRLERQLADFPWLHRDTKTGGWRANACALGRLWEGRQPPGKGGGLPVVIEGTLAEASIARTAATPVPPLRLKPKRLVLTTAENGEMRLTAILSAAGAARLRRMMSGL